MRISEKGEKEGKEKAGPETVALLPFVTMVLVLSTYTEKRNLVVRVNLHMQGNARHPSV